MVGHIKSNKGPGKIKDKLKNNSCLNCNKLIKQNIDDRSMLYFILGVLETRVNNYGFLRPIYNKLKKHLDKRKYNG